MAVNKLRQNSDPKVVALSKEIVSKWKADVAKNKPKGTPARKTSSASPTVANASIKKEAVKTEPGETSRSSKSDGVDTAVTGDKTRDNCVQLLYNGLCSDSDAREFSLVSVIMPCTKFHQLRRVSLTWSPLWKPKSSQTTRRRLTRRTSVGFRPCFSTSRTRRTPVCGNASFPGRSLRNALLPWRPLSWLRRSRRRRTSAFGRRT